jgi:cbb3-type cytochrome oxidase subunit 3
MRKATKIVAISIFWIAFLAISYGVIVPALNAPHEKAIAICDQKLALNDQRAIALDHNDQAKYDQLTAQEDSIKGC